MGVKELIPRGTVALAIGSVYWAVQNREWFGSWAQEPGNWSEPLVVHVVVNATGAAGLTTAPAAELVSCKRPSACPQLLRGSAAPLALWPAEPMSLIPGPLSSPTERPVLPQHTTTARQPFETRQLNCSCSWAWGFLVYGILFSSSKCHLPLSVAQR